MKVTDDCRPLREFYPDPELRHQVHYAFAHQFLPQYVFQSPYRFFWNFYNQELPPETKDPTLFIHSRWTVIFERGLGLTDRPPGEGEMVRRRVTDLSMTIQELGGRPSALIEMPVPEYSPQAFRVCAVLLTQSTDPKSWSHDVQARVFTLELMHPDENEIQRGLVGEWTPDNAHRIRGTADPGSKSAFLAAVNGALQHSAPPTP